MRSGVCSMTWLLGNLAAAFLPLKQTGASVMFRYGLPFTRLNSHPPRHIRSSLASPLLVHLES